MSVDINNKEQAETNAEAMFNIVYVHGNQKARQDGQPMIALFDFHTAPEL